MLGLPLIGGGVKHYKDKKRLEAYLKDPQNKLDDYKNLYEKLTATRQKELMAKGNYSPEKALLEASDDALWIVQRAFRFNSKIHRRESEKYHKKSIPVNIRTKINELIKRRGWRY